MDVVQSESLQSLLASLRQHTHPLAAASIAALHRGDVIEIQGPAASGKTHLLYDILLALLLADADADGAIAAVVYDTDASFDIQRFRRLLLSRLPSSALDPLQSVRRSLARLHVFRPTSLSQLAASIANLPAYHSSHMPNQEIAVLAIDSISSFYWADRFSAEQLHSTAQQSVAMALPLHHVLSAVQSMRCSHSPLVVLTNWALNAATGSSYRQHLHPFLALADSTADLGAKVSGSTDRSSSSPSRLQVTHHIALASPSSPPPPDDPLPRGTRHMNKIVSCLSRSSATRDIVRSAFQITDDDILVVHQTS